MRKCFYILENFIYEIMCWIFCINIGSIYWELLRVGKDSFDCNVWKSLVVFFNYNNVVGEDDSNFI